MNSANALRYARRKAGFTQRQLAVRADVHQSVIARIESGRVVPRVDTLDGLLRAAGQELSTRAQIGIGVDRSLIASFLKKSPRERIESLISSSAALRNLMLSARRS